LAGEGFSSSIISPKLISISPCNDRLNIKEWLKEKHSKDRAATPAMRQSKLFIEESSDKLYTHLCSLDRNQCSLVRELPTCHCALRHRLRINVLSDTATCRKCGGEDSSPTLAGHKMKMLASVWLQLIDVRRPSIILKKKKKKKKKNWLYHCQRSLNDFSDTGVHDGPSTGLSSLDDWWLPHMSIKNTQVRDTAQTTWYHIP
jgi:hypothetical protein